MINCNEIFKIVTVPMEYRTIILLILTGAFGIYYLFRNINIFKRHNIIHISPVLILGAMTSLIFRCTSFVDCIKEIYNFNPDAKYVGFYVMTNPIILLRDPELIKAVFIKHFKYFPNRSGFGDSHDSLLARNLFFLQGEKWRDTRRLLSACFTSGKLKTMFTLMSECAVDFSKFISTLPEKEIDMKDAFTKYTNDVIAICAFGIKINSMKDPMNKFYVNSKDATNFFGIRIVKFILLRIFPKFGRILNLKLINNHVSNFFKNIIKTTINERDTEHIIRPDMIQLMMDIRGKENKRVLDVDDMAAQAFIFIFGGFETSSSAMSFAAHEIAANPDIQTKLHQEIDKALEKWNGEVTYEAINQLEYLDAVINESFRLYPPVILERICNETYELPSALSNEKPFIMKKGMTFWIPVFAIHHDEKYYDNPEKFRPERFLNNKSYHNSSLYMPFGLGSRMCIANRFAILQIKVLLFHLLARCQLKPCAKTRLPLQFSKKSLLMSPEGGFWLNIQRRSDMHPVLESNN